MARTQWSKKYPRQARARATFDAIIEAAAQLLAHTGELNTNEIAERAGVSIGSVYQYFNDKVGILGELGERVVKATSAIATQHVDALWEVNDAAQGLEAFIRGAADRRRQPVIRRLLRLAKERGYLEFIQAYLNVLDRSVQDSLRKRPEFTGNAMGSSLLLRAISGALEHAADNTDWLDDPTQFEQVVDELTLLAHAYLTADREAWDARPRNG